MLQVTTRDLAFCIRLGKGNCFNRICVGPKVRSLQQLVVMQTVITCVPTSQESCLAQLLKLENDITVAGHAIKAKSQALTAAEKQHALSEVSMLQHLFKAKLRGCLLHDPVWSAN